MTAIVVSLASPAAAVKGAARGTDSGTDSGQSFADALEKSADRNQISNDQRQQNDEQPAKSTKDDPASIDSKPASKSDPTAKDPANTGGSETTAPAAAILALAQQAAVAQVPSVLTPTPTAKSSISKQDLAAAAATVVGSSSAPATVGGVAVTAPALVAPIPAGPATANAAKPASTANTAPAANTVPSAPPKPAVADVAEVASQSKIAGAAAPAGKSTTIEKPAVAAGNSAAAKAPAVAETSAAAGQTATATPQDKSTPSAASTAVALTASTPRAPDPAPATVQALSNDPTLSAALANATLLSTTRPKGAGQGAPKPTSGEAAASPATLPLIAATPVLVNNAPSVNAETPVNTAPLNAETPVNAEDSTSSALSDPNLLGTQNPATRHATEPKTKEPSSHPTSSEQTAFEPALPSAAAVGVAAQQPVDQSSASQAAAAATAIGAPAPAGAGTAVTTTSAPAAYVAPQPLYQQMAQPMLNMRAAGDGTHRIIIQLHPQDLGSVSVEVRIRNGDMTVALTSGSEATRASITAALPALHQQLTDAGLNDVKIAVDSSSVGTPGGGTAGRDQGQAQSRQARMPASSAVSASSVTPDYTRAPTRSRSIPTSGVDRWL